MNRVCISSCGGNEVVYGELLQRLARLSRSRETVFVESPAVADLILVVDIKDQNLYGNLRRNRVWRRYPAKAFGVDEDDSPPPFLHGVYASLPKDWTASGRFQSFGYYIHSQRFSNACPDPELVWRAPKDLLFSFSGRISHGVREQLFRLQFPAGKVLLEDTSAYNHFQADLPSEVSRSNRERYWTTAMRAKFALCPRGNGTSSIRLFEMMEAGIPPVIISDEWTPPVGPRWEEFALFVPEARIGSLFQIVKAHEGEYAERGRLARRAHEEFFAPDRYWDGLMRAIDHIRQNQRVPEAFYARTAHLWVLRQKLRRQRIKWGTRLKRYF